MSTTEDAREFGQHFLGGWQLGLLVARNVHKQTGAGRPPKSEQVRNKVSCTRFAQLAGVSVRTVQLYYDAWELAAEEGHCTPAAQLYPGAADPLLHETDAAEHHEMWRKFYRQVRDRRSDGATTDSKRRQRSSASGPTTSRTQSRDSTAEDQPASGGVGGHPAPEDHPLYGLMIAVNQLADELKRRSPATSVMSAAAKVVAKEHRAALRRTIGAL